MIYGSEGDWISQHVAIAESLRDAMLEQHSLIPQYIGLGGGSSVYDFSYYGLLRPDVLLSCLLPGIDMGYIISGYGILSIVASAVLMFVWLSRHGIQKKFSAAGAFLLVCSGSFFQFHHQIMFVNYMPFLILALLGTDRLWQKRRSGLLVLSLVLVYLHSFYYAIACLCVVGCYGLYLVLESWSRTGEEKSIRTRRRELLGMGGRLALCVAISVAMAMVLLLPTGLDILSTTKDGGSFVKETVKAVDLSFRGLLYSSYSCGMTLLALYSLLLSLTVKGQRFLSAALLAVVTVPAVSLVLNGFLYAREKILIPFVPLLVLVTIQTLQRVWRKEQRARFWPALLCFVPLFFDGRKTPYWKEIILLDAGVLAGWALLSCLDARWNRTWSRRLLGAGFLLLGAAPLATSVTLNCSEKYIASGDQRQKHFTKEEVAEVASDRNYRFDVIADRLENSNLLYGNTNRSSMYSSITNDQYGTFYYDTIGNAIPANNRVALLPGVNPCANYFLGVRYLLCKEGQLPAGYKVRLEKEGYVLAENPAVLPICYGTTDVPVTEENLEGNEQENPGEEDSLGAGLLAEHLKELCAGMDIKLPVAVARLKIDSSGKKPVVITLNGVRNKLSADSAPYPNGNTVFTYVMATNQRPEEWSRDCSKGNYTVAEEQYLTIRPEEWGSRQVILPKAAESGANVYSGSIDMPKEGWFVTSYPWREGYQVWVDQRPVEPRKVNTAFVGFPLIEGVHRIAISYTAPGYEIGLGGTLVGSMAFIVLLLWEKGSRRALFRDKRKASDKEGEM